MLRTNLSYAATQQMGQTVSTAIQNSIQQAKTLLQNFQSIGFKAEVSTALNVVPVGVVGLNVSFDKVDFDLTGNVTNPTTFTIQAAGNYAVVISLNWSLGPAGVRTCSLWLNGTTVLGTFSTDSSQAGPTVTQLSATQYLNAGDVLTVVASDNLNTVQSLLAGSYISATLTDTTQVAVTSSVPPSGVSSTLTFTSNVAISTLTALAVTSNGNISPIDPTQVLTDGSGDPIYPIVTGVSLSSASAGGTVIVGTNYGGVYELTGANFTVGGLIYAGVGGVLTQNYTSVVSTCKWIVVVGRAISTNQFIYEPHIPNLTSFGTF